MEVYRHNSQYDMYTYVSPSELLLYICQPFGTTPLALPSIGTCSPNHILLNLAMDRSKQILFSTPSHTEDSLSCANTTLNHPYASIVALRRILATLPASTSDAGHPNPDNTRNIIRDFARSCTRANSSPILFRDIETVHSPSGHLALCGSMHAVRSRGTLEQTLADVKQSRWPAQSGFRVPAVILPDTKQILVHLPHSQADHEGEAADDCMAEGGSGEMYILDSERAAMTGFEQLTIITVDPSDVDVGRAGNGERKAMLLVTTKYHPKVLAGIAGLSSMP